MQTLLAAPFSLATGAGIYVKVLAINEVGSSPYSLIGNGGIAFLSVVPDAPISVARDEATSTLTSIGVAWTQGVSNGGQTVIDYRISYD